MERDRNGGFFERGHFGLDAQPLLLELADPLLGVLLGYDVLDHKINVALPLTFYSVTFRRQSRTHRDCVPRKPLSFTVIAAHISLDQPRIL
ncbi:hypothetical protein [Bradyrhizobium sp. Arg816]|uniref:hypothetical protein n=1 Tax=Bradyrhizobium sp. Arg816 TaxID=2998491 RepID=UPI00249EDFF0|nr:hypothetical protein [Bradyrhizobium sp. Arg816]MDI3566894.1 hypothetical protein [Bradyrhizobium sp. Arg816]